jgi:hypothetical protein
MTARRTPVLRGEAIGEVGATWEKVLNEHQRPNLGTLTERVTAVHGDLWRSIANLQALSSQIFGPPLAASNCVAKDAPRGDGALAELEHALDLVEQSLPHLEMEISRFGGLV